MNNDSIYIPDWYIPVGLNTGEIEKSIINVQ